MLRPRSPQTHVGQPIAPTEKSTLMSHTQLASAETAAGGVQRPVSLRPDQPSGRSPYTALDLCRRYRGEAPLSLGSDVFVLSCL